MFRTYAGPFVSIATYLFEEHQKELLATAYDRKNYYRIEITERQYEMITNDVNFLPNSYVALKGVYATLERFKPEGDTKYRNYIKIHLEGF